jgi:4-carboxymuconolactone decarboxylase
MNEKYDKGMARRREVLGDEHVDRAIANTTDLDRDFQTWITEKVWGDLWTRPGVSTRDRSLVTIAILAALGHDELGLHLRAARDNGVAPEEVGEVLLHVATYAGVPAANHAFAMFKDVYSEER